MAKFEASTISDQKRLVRGEHYLMARKFLRLRDHIHHAKWRVLTLAGGSPAGEIRAIQEIMPKAHITAVDRDPNCLAAAIEAGVHDVIECDLDNWTIEGKRRYPAEPLRSADPFDIVNLDLCAGASQATKNICQAYRSLLAPGGVLMVTVSYGRDVAEVFQASLEAAKIPDWKYEDNKRVDYRPIDQLQPVIDQCGELVAGRLFFLFTKRPLEQLRSVMAYRGAEMPMISLLFHPTKAPLSVVKCEPGDFEIAAAHPDPALMYDCPQDRIEALRRKHAAIKAAYTTRERRESKPTDLLSLVS